MIPITGQCADLRAAEEAVAVAGNFVVSGFAEEFGKSLQKRCCEIPGSAELLQYEQSRTGTREQAFIFRFVVEDNINRIQIARIYAVAREDASGEIALQRSEVEGLFAVAAKNELDEAVAESADTVVEEDGIRHWSLQKRL